MGWNDLQPLKTRVLGVPVDALFGDQHAVCAARSKTVAIKCVAGRAYFARAGGQFDHENPALRQQFRA